MLDGFQLRVEQIIGNVLGPQGFALGGGHALQAHGIVERPSKDLDSYTASMDPDVFARAEDSLIAALRGGQLDASVEGTDSWFRQIIVTDPSTGDVVSVDLGYDYRQNLPVIIQGIGPVLDVEDVVLGKLRALSDRQAERDFVDVDAILADGRWAARLGDPVEYAALGLSPSGITAMLGRLNQHAEQIAPDGTRDQRGVPSTGGGSSTCSRCGRPLRAAESIARGYGPGCAKKS